MSFQEPPRIPEAPDPPPVPPDARRWDAAKWEEFHWDAVDKLLRAIQTLCECVGHVNRQNIKLRGFVEQIAASNYTTGPTMAVEWIDQAVELVTDDDA